LVFWWDYSSSGIDGAIKPAKYLCGQVKPLDDF